MGLLFEWKALFDIYFSLCPLLSVPAKPRIILGALSWSNLSWSWLNTDLPSVCPSESVFSHCLIAVPAFQLKYWERERLIYSLPFSLPLYPAFLPVPVSIVFWLLTSGCLSPWLWVLAVTPLRQMSFCFGTLKWGRRLIVLVRSSEALIIPFIQRFQFLDF